MRTRNSYQRKPSTTTFFTKFEFNFTGKEEEKKKNVKSSKKTKKKTTKRKIAKLKNDIESKKTVKKPKSLVSKKKEDLQNGVKRLKSSTAKTIDMISNLNIRFSKYLSGMTISSSSSSDETEEDDSDDEEEEKEEELAKDYYFRRKRPKEKPKIKISGLINLKKAIILAMKHKLELPNALKDVLLMFKIFEKNFEFLFNSSQRPEDVSISLNRLKQRIFQQETM